MRDPRLPPRPPKMPYLPRGFFDRWFWLVLVLNSAALALNLYFAWQNRAGGWLLFINCGGLAMTTIAIMRFFETCYRSIREYRAVRIMYESTLNAIENITLDLLNEPGTHERDDLLKRVQAASQQTIDHMRGLR